VGSCLPSFIESDDVDNPARTHGENLPSVCLTSALRRGLIAHPQVALAVFEKARELGVNLIGVHQLEADENPVREHDGL
jgi:hypothetical protein